MTVRSWLKGMALVGLSIWLAACADGPGGRAGIQTSPTLAPSAANASEGASPSRVGLALTPSPSLPPTVTPMDTPPPPPPTATATPTETPGPYEHVIQSGDTCLNIAYQYGHLVPDVKTEIERLNNMRDCSILPGPGSTILIPRPTATQTPVGADLTQTAVATSGPSFSVQSYTVQEGDTLSSIAILNDSSLRQICELNPLPDGIDCGGCQWETANCCCPNPPIFSPGDTVNVPGPTPTPTASPTFTGSETPTPTPTHRAPQPVSPADGATIMGPVRLAWLTSGVLAPEEHYLVSVRDETAGTEYSNLTRQLSLDVPVSMLPSDGQTHVLVWQVTVQRLGQDGFLYPVGAAVPERRLNWQGWE
jgi:hypothetical protein